MSSGAEEGASKALHNCQQVGEEDEEEGKEKEKESFLEVGPDLPQASLLQHPTPGGEE